MSRLRFRDRNRQETLGGEAVLCVSWQQFRSHHEGAKGCLLKSSSCKRKQASISTQREQGQLLPAQSGDGSKTDTQPQTRAPLPLAAWLLLPGLVGCFFFLSSAQWQWTLNQAHGKHKLLSEEFTSQIILNIGPIVPVELHVPSRMKFTAVVTPFFWEVPRFLNNNNLVLVLPRSNRFV